MTVRGIITMVARSNGPSDHIRIRAALLADVQKNRGGTCNKTLLKGALRDPLSCVKRAKVVLRIDDFGNVDNTSLRWRR